MRSIAKLTGTGLLAVLAVAAFVACKKEKEQNGPEIIVGSGTNVRANDTMIIGNIRPIILELSIKKGSGKDDGDLKSYTVVVKKDGSTTNDGYSGNAPNGSAFTLRDTFPFEPQSPTTYEITVTVTDKNEKSASKTFKIAYINPPQSVGTYYMGTITLTAPSGFTSSPTPFIYLAGTNIEARNLSQLQEAKNVIGALIVRDVPENKYSLVSPEVLGNSPYNLDYINWTASPKPSTAFYAITQNEYNSARDSVSIAQVVQSATNATKFVQNNDGIRALIGGTPHPSSNETSGPHLYLAFRQQYPSNNPTSRLWGVIKVELTDANAARLEVKLIVR